MSTFCPGCKIVFRPKEAALWCTVKNCPCTNQTKPTPAQFQKLKMFERPYFGERPDEADAGRNS